jgi:hypothetical protein
LLKIKLLLSALFLFIVSCTGEQPAVRPTIDVTQRWLNAKCPPPEVCAPKNSPEDIGLAYLEAIIAGKCDEAAGYWMPDSRPRGMEVCLKGIVPPGKPDNPCQLIDFKTDEIIIEQLTQGKSILFSGYFLYDCGDDSGKYETNALMLTFDDRDGEWLLFGIDG